MKSKLPSNLVDLRSLELYALGAGQLAITVAGFVLLGWMFDASVLKGVLPGRATMKSALSGREGINEK
jgi:hypothetical protein